MSQGSRTEAEAAADEPDVDKNDEDGTSESEDTQQPKEEPAKMTRHDMLARALEFISEGVRTGSIVSLRSAESLIKEVMQGKCRVESKPSLIKPKSKSKSKSRSRR